MDSLSFISAVIHDLAWPITVLILVAFLLRRLPQISRLVKSVRYKDLEITIRDRLDEIERLPAASGADGQQVAVMIDPNDKILRLAQVDTGVAVAAIWTGVESSLFSLMQHNGVVRFTNPAKFAEQLASLGKLSSDDLLMLRKLREVRNASVHGRGEAKPTIAEVTEFNRYANLLIAKIESVRAQPGYIDVPSESRPGKEHR